MGRAHGLDGSFYVDGPDVELLKHGGRVTVAGRSATVVRRAGTDARPVIRLSGVDGREAASALRGQELSAAGETSVQRAPGEWDATELIGCEVPGIGAVTRVIAAPSCDLLEVGRDGVLVPFVSDAVRSVDVDARVIEVDLRFLGLEEGGATRA